MIALVYAVGRGLHALAGALVSVWAYMHMTVYMLAESMGVERLYSHK